MTQATRQTKWFGTALSGVPLVIPVAMQYWDTGFQIVAEGANTLQIETQVQNGNYIILTSIIGQGLLVDLYDVTNVRITASGGNVGYTLTVRQSRTSIPDSKWETFLPGN